MDWDAGHGPVTGPINCGLTALTVGWAGNVTGMPTSWAAIAAGAGWAGTHIAGLRKGVTTATLAMRTAAWLGAGAWCSWAIANGPWTQWGIGTLIAGTLGLGGAMAGAHHVEAEAAEKKTAAEAEARRASLDGKRAATAKEWEERIARVCNGTVVQIVGVEDWATGSGFTLEGEFGPGGAKWRDIASASDAMASDARLPEGCGIEVGPGVHRGAVLINVATANALIADAPYPDDYTPLSINEPAPIGVYRDGEPAAPVMRQRSALIVGRRGSGKTNLMNVQLANQMRMTDNLAWVIDLNGGGLALPWLHAWEALGRPGRPPIDWVADTPEKALAMAQAALRIAKARKPGYKTREIAANDDKLPVDATVPALTLNNDEIAELFSPRARRDPVLRETGDTLVQVMEIARAAAVNILNAALRATQDVVSEPQLLKQSALRIGMKSDEVEMNYLFGWNDKASPDEAPYPGCGFMKLEDDPARPVKIYRLKPDQIKNIVAGAANLRPVLDDLSVRAAGNAYTNRWDGTEHLFGNGPAPATAPEAPTASPARGSGVTADWGKPDTARNDSDVQAVLDDADAARRKLHDAMGEASTRDPDLEREFRRILDGGGATWQPPADTTTPDPRRQMVYDIVAGSGPEGIGPAAIIDALTRLHPGTEAPHPDVITRWLGADPRIHKPRHGRYAVRPDQT
ncbi:hypothetical protein ACIO6U_02710 [Streptomyces sp. NPDC087422]|uniref:hypothetical protein n=1 Tax=Streptomyces sp. NPDC087422 TaxID=3365786 RepID=UPI0038193B7B